MKPILSILIYSLASGGAERVVSILLNELKDNYKVTLFLMNDTIFYALHDNIKIVYLEKSNPLESGLKKLFKLPYLAWKYKRLNNSTVSLSFMNRPNYINILAKMMGMKSKVIISERAMPSLQHAKGIQGKLNKFLITTLYPLSDIITANSYGNTQDLHDNFLCKDVKIVNNPIDIKNIAQLSQDDIVLDKSKFIFITIGRLDSGKNHKLIIDAIKDIDAKLYIIGDGELREELELSIVKNRLQNKVVLLGKIENPYKYLVQANCFIFSSNNEGFPNVLLEALACELPIISTDCQSGPREILAPESNLLKQLKDDIEMAKFGILTPVNNKKSLTKAMKLIMDNKELREGYHKKAKDRAEEFDKDNIIQKWIDIIDK